MRMTEKEIRIEARERTDYKAFQQICHYKMKKMPPMSKWDAVTENSVVELKNRDKYEIGTFDTFTLSLHKLDHLAMGRKEEEKPYSCVVAFYPLSNKAVVFDTTELTPNNADIVWRKVKKTEYDDEENAEWEWKPFASLSLKEGRHKNYRTIVLDADLSWTNDDYRRNVSELRKYYK